MKTKTAISLAIAVSAVGSVATTNAAFMFDPDGDDTTNNTVSMTQFDYIGNTSVLAQGGNLATQNFLLNQTNGCSGDDTLCLDTTFTVLTHSTVGSLVNTDTATSSSVVNEISLVVGFVEDIVAVDFTGVGGTTAQATFAAVPTAEPNFFQMYYDPTPDANYFNGTGFGSDLGSTLIFSSELVSTEGVTNNFSVDTTATPIVLDQSNAGADDDWAGANAGDGQLTVNGSGNQTNINLATDLATAFFNQDFFLFDELTTAFLLDINLNVPFRDNDPSRQFYTTGGLVNPDYVVYDNAGGATTLGLVSGQLVIDPDTGEITISGDDFMITTDANLTVTGISVPEPHIVALLGFGLLGMGLARRKHRHS